MAFVHSTFLALLDSTRVRLGSAAGICVSITTGPLLGAASLTNDALVLSR